MEQVIILLAVTVSFPSPAVLIKLDKRVMIGSTILFSEPHYHEVPAEETMPDGLARLTDYLELNNWPDITAQDRSVLLNVTNAARGAQDQGAEGEV